MKCGDGPAGRASTLSMVVNAVVVDFMAGTSMLFEPGNHSGRRPTLTASRPLLKQMGTKRTGAHSQSLTGDVF